MKLLPLTRGLFSKVDDSDFEDLSQFKWQIAGNIEARTFYAQRNVFKDGKWKKEKLHRRIMNCPKGLTVDHINGDGLDNQRSNLRICTESENLKNRKHQKNRCSSKFIGVSRMRNKKSIKWSAKIWTDGRTMWLGCFDIEVDAAKKYDAEAFRLRGEFAKLNFQRGSGPE